ncbi:hypothetical protein LXL04_009335 [Taraxacum kok-saghyz]
MKAEQGVDRLLLGKHKCLRLCKGRTKQEGAEQNGIRSSYGRNGVTSAEQESRKSSNFVIKKSFKPTSVCEAIHGHLVGIWYHSDLSKKLFAFSLIVDYFHVVHAQIISVSQNTTGAHRFLMKKALDNLGNTKWRMRISHAGFWIVSCIIGCHPGKTPCNSIFIHPYSLCVQFLLATIRRFIIPDLNTREAQRTLYFKNPLGCELCGGEDGCGEAIQEDHEKKKAELEAMQIDINNQREKFEEMIQKFRKQQALEGLSVKRWPNKALLRPKIQAMMNT